MADYTIRDNNTKLIVNCLKRDGSAFNLTGHTLNFRYRIGSIDHVLKAMTILDAANGVAQYDFGLGTGVSITLGVNDQIYFSIAHTPEIPCQIPASTFQTYEALCAHVETAMNSVNPMGPVYCTYNATTRRVRFHHDTQTIDLVWANPIDNVGPTLGFDSDFDDSGLQEYFGDFDVFIALPDDLSEQGIMYAEIEITETSSGKIVSSSDELIFVVRGKVSDG